MWTVRLISQNQRGDVGTRDLTINTKREAYKTALTYAGEKPSIGRVDHTYLVRV